MPIPYLIIHITHLQVEMGRINKQMADFEQETKKRLAGLKNDIEQELVMIPLFSPHPLLRTPRQLLRVR